MGNASAGSRRDGQDGKRENQSPGKNRLTSDHILRRLQGESQKSHEIGADHHNLTSAVNDIQDTLGGSLVSPTFCSLIYYLNSCSSPPYPSSHYPRSTPHHTRPPNRSINPHHPPHPFSQSSKPSSMIPSPPLRATSTNYVRSKALSLSTTLSSVRSASSGSLLRS
jgi:hypothetical protein